MAFAPVLISQQIKDPPDKTSYAIGNPVFGSGLSNLGDRINFLAYTKARRVANVYYATNHHDTWTANTTNMAVGSPLTMGYISKTEDDHEFPITASKDYIYTCNHHARFLGFAITYNCDHLLDPLSDPYIRVKLFTGATKNLAVGSRTYIDAGVEFSISNGFLNNSSIQASGNDTHILTYAYTAQSGSLMEVPAGGSYIAMTIPRPLFIPSAYRGQEIGIEITYSYCRILILSLHELFEGSPI